MSNNFDRWRNDVFFSAAEEVQDSADIMESTYRTWMRDRRDGSRSDDSYDFRRELQTALGTTKWQLEEFEKAIKSSHQNCLSDDTVARHKQFVVAIESQISRVEMSLKESIIEEGRPALRWVELDEEERDDLALFLSGTPGTSQEMKDAHVNPGPSKKNELLMDSEVDADHIIDHRDCIKGFKEVVTIQKDAKYVVELASKRLPKTREEIHSQGERLNGNRRTTSLPDFGAWKIVIADEDAQRKTLESQTGKPTRVDNLCGLFRGIEPGDKLKWFRSQFRKPKDRGMDMFNARSRSCFRNLQEDCKISRVRQRFGWVGGFRQQLQGSHYNLQFTRPLQITFVLMLTIFLLKKTVESLSFCLVRPWGGSNRKCFQQLRDLKNRIYLCGFNHLNDKICL